MLRFLALLMMLPLVSCNDASTAGRTATYGSNKYGSVSPYIRSFDSHYFLFKGGNLPINDLKITMTNSLNNSQAIGTCYSVSKEIKILESYWNGASESQKRLLIYHELAHCYLNRPHKNKLVNGVPVSIMYPSSLHGSNFKAFESMYIEELFTNDSTNIERTLASYSSSFPRILESKTDTYHYQCNHE